GVVDLQPGGSFHLAQGQGVAAAGGEVHVHPDHAVAAANEGGARHFQAIATAAVGQVHGAFVDEGAEVGERGRADGRGGEQAGVDQAVVAGTEVAAGAGHPGADVVEHVVAVGQADRADDRVAVVVDRRRAAADHQCVTTGADDLAVDVDGAARK